MLSLRIYDVKPSELQEFAYANAKQLEAEIRKANLPFRRDLPYRLGQLVQALTDWLGHRNFDVRHFERCLYELEASPRSRVFDYLAIDYYDPFIAHVFRLPSFSDFEFEPLDFRGWLMSGITSKWWDWRCLPEGLHFFCSLYSRMFGKVVDADFCPILIAENGMALRRKPDNSVAARRSDQIHRSQFLEEHVAQVSRLLDEKIPLLGYLHWSLTDNYEWGSYTPRFGLFSLDFEQGTDRLVEDHLGDRPSETYARLIQQHKQRDSQSHSPIRTLHG